MAPVNCIDPSAGEGGIWDWLVLDHAAVPMLPAAAMRVIQLAASPDSSLMHITEAVSKDQVLASRVLALANSAFSSPASRISSLADAVVRMGVCAVRNLVVTISFGSRTTDPNVYGSQGRDLVDHSIGTAYVARLVADEVDVDAEQAYLYGLLHDIGKLIILKLASDHKRRTGTAVPPAELAEVSTRYHATVGGLAMRRWNLPDGLDEPVMCHHEYLSASVSPKDAMVAHIANKLSHRYGFGCPAEADDFLTDPAAVKLGLTERWLASTDERAPGLYSVARAFLDPSGPRNVAAPRVA
jgi:putative nucleotidyltransferase with HDIG domain